MTTSDNGSVVSIKNGKVNHSIEIEQVFPDRREYLIMAFVDFKQVPFYVEKKLYDNYEIFLDGKDYCEVSVSLDNLEYSKELAYIIIKMPNYKLKDKEMKRSHIVQEVMALRFNLGEKKETVKYETNFRESSEKPLDNIFISEKESVLKIKYNAKPKDSLYLTLGNLGNYEMDYSIIALLNWKQVPINNDMIKTFNLKKNERIFFDFEIPTTKENSNYQILAFPNPYKVDPKNVESTFVYGSHRLTIKP